MALGESSGYLMRFKQGLKDFNELVVFEHTIFSLPFTLIAMLTASYHSGGFEWFGWQILCAGLLAAVTARNFAMAFNRYCDQKIDASNPRTLHRPSADGRISRTEMLIFIIVNAVAFVLISSWINTLAFALSFPFLAILALYSYMKYFSSLAHIVLGICLGLAPIAGAVAVSETIPLWSVWLACGVVFWVAGFDILYSIQDIEFDKQNALHSIPSLLGMQKSLLVARGCHVLAIVFWSGFLYISPLSAHSYFAILISAIMLTYEHYLVARNLSNIPKAFFVVNGYLGVVFLIILTMDMLL